VSVKRETRESRVDARHIATATLSTGVTIERTTEWEPSHWGKVEELRAALVRDTRAELADLERQFGLTASGFRVWREQRMVAHVIETRVASRKLVSEHA
jgi:hypothetical protein